jgi:polyhydroxybutyrate depolymerase
MGMTRALRVAAGPIAAIALLLLPPTLEAQGLARGRGATTNDLHTLVHAGLKRTYVVRTPRGLSRSGTPLPVVVVLHGGGGNAENGETMTGFTELVERERIIVVYPDGTAARARVTLHTWNAVHCCGHAMEAHVDDVGFVNAMLDSLVTTYPVDANRIYATGMSNGAMMTHRLGRELSRRFAAIAPVVGAVFGDEPDAKGPVSALMINGLLDKAVPAEGGPTGGRSAREWDGTPTKPNLAQGAYWARANGCAAVPKRSERGAVITWRYDCPSGRAVEILQLRDGGHAWPGGERGSRVGDRPSTVIDATEVMWAFFKAHPRRN